MTSPLLIQLIYLAKSIFIPTAWGTPDTNEEINRTGWYTHQWNNLEHFQGANKTAQKNSNDDSSTDTWVSSNSDTTTSGDMEEGVTDIITISTPKLHPNQRPIVVTTTETPKELPKDPRWTPLPKPSRWKIEWVASHQDNNTTISISTLSTGTQRNIKADKLATMGPC